MNTEKTVFVSKKGYIYSTRIPTDMRKGDYVFIGATVSIEPEFLDNGGNSQSKIQVTNLTPISRAVFTLPSESWQITSRTFEPKLEFAIWYHFKSPAFKNSGFHVTRLKQIKHSEYIIGNFAHFDADELQTFPELQSLLWVEPERVVKTLGYITYHMARLTQLAH